MKAEVDRPKLYKRRSKKAGLPPGTLLHVGEKKVEAIRIVYIDYDEQNFAEKQVSRVEECFPFKATPTVTWINVDGLHEVETIEKLGKEFELHPLILEDILTTEEELVSNPADSTLRQIHGLKREMISLRRSVWPLRELISALQRGESPLIHKSTQIYLRDVYDGMNFEYMPELKWRWSYAAVWLVMAVTAAIMLFFFKRRKWL